MFESALIEHKLDKETYRREEPLLRSALLEAQLALVDKKPFSVVILVTGMDGAGKGAGHPPPAGVARPAGTSGWRPIASPTIPSARGRPCGATGVTCRRRAGSPSCSARGTTEPLRRHVNGQTGKGRFGRDLADINRFEQMLASEDTVLLKFLLVVSAKEQKRRLDAFAKLAGGASQPLEEWADFKQRKSVLPIIEEFVRRTSTDVAPWIVLPCDDPEYRDLTFGRTILETLRRRLAGPPAPAPTPVSAVIPNIDRAQRVGCARPVLEARRCGLQGAPGGGPAPAARASAGTRASATGRWWWRSRGTTPPAKAAPSAA